MVVLDPVAAGRFVLRLEETVARPGPVQFLWQKQRNASVQICFGQQSVASVAGPCPAFPIKSVRPYSRAYVRRQRTEKKHVSSVFCS